MERKNQKKKESENGSTGEVAMTRGAKKNKRGRKKLSPDVTTVLRPPRVNLGLTYPSHTHHMHTHTHTQSSNALQISVDNTFIWICIYLHFLSTDTHTNTHNLTRHSAGMATPSQTCTHAHTNMYTLSQAKNKDINMTKCLCGSTQRSIHTLRDTLTHSKGSRGSSELTNPLVNEPAGSLVDFFFAVVLSICITSSQFVSLSGSPRLLFFSLLFTRKSEFRAVEVCF